MTHPEVVEEVASRRQQHFVLVLSGLLLVSVLLILPIASRPLTPLPHVSGMFGAATAMIDLATFWLLASAPRQPRSHAIVAAAYLFGGLMAVVHLLTFPGAVLPERAVIGSPHAVSLLFIVWRAGFAAFVLWAVIAAGREHDGERQPFAWLPTVLAVIGVGVSFFASQFSDVAALHHVAGREFFGAFSRYGSYSSGLLALVALVMIWRRRLFGRALFLWLVFVLIAEGVGVWLSTFGGGRYTVAWYATRVEGILASSVVLMLLAHHFRKLQIDLGVTVDALRQRTEGLQAEVHRRENAEVKLAQASKLEAVGRLGAGLAHDLNNILQVITARLAILQRRVGPAVEADVEVMRRSVKKADALTRQLTLLSGKRSLNARALDLGTALPLIAESLQTLLGQKHRLDLDAEPHLPGIHVDPLELEIALTNLVTNARDATPDGGTIRITAVASSGEHGEAQVCVQVHDEGEGMSPELLQRVFEPFFTTKEPGKGTGLGLLQVYAFVTASDGTVDVKSQPGRGTVVTLCFPVAAPDRLAAPMAAMSSEAFPLRAGESILLLDDNVDVREASAQLLAATGCVVRQAGTAREALALMEEGFSPELLISDIVMPGGMNGVELARKVRGLKPGLRIVLVTGYSDAVASAEAGGFPVVRKPYDLSALVAALRS